MISTQLQPIVVILALLCGAALGQFWRQRWILRNRARLRQEARLILRDAERAGQGTIIDAELKAKEIGLLERRQLEQERERCKEDLLERERLLAKREQLLGARQEGLEKREAAVDQILKQCNAESSAAEKLRGELLAKLENCANLSAEQARQTLLDEVASVNSALLAKRRQDLIDESQQTARERSREILATVMERLSPDVLGERAVCLLPLPSEEMRGRVVGREGRNIRAFEAISGVDVLLDEIPGQIMLSSHNPERRETARLAMLALLEDGRIQPSRIEEFIKNARDRLDSTLFRLAQQAAENFGINDMAPEVIEVLGRLHLRRSYAQNVLSHSLETAQIAKLLGQEIGLDEARLQILTKAALLHDIGKALSDNYNGPHALVGAEFLQRYESSELLLNAIAAHHGETEDQSLLCQLLRTADKLSGARPGARREDLQNYIKRLQGLEQIALSFKGVERAYALRAGRELQLLVASQEISDEGLYTLVQDISEAIKRGYSALGEVEIHALREVKIIQRVCHLP